MAAGDIEKTDDYPALRRKTLREEERAGQE